MNSCVEALTDASFRVVSNKMEKNKDLWCLF